MSAGTYSMPREADSGRSGNDILVLPTEMIPTIPQKIDPELYEIQSFLFPGREEFFKAMGWEDNL